MHNGQHFVFVHRVILFYWYQFNCWKSNATGQADCHVFSKDRKALWYFSVYCSKATLNSFFIKEVKTDVCSVSTGKKATIYCTSLRNWQTCFAFFNCGHLMIFSTFDMSALMLLCEMWWLKKSISMQNRLLFLREQKSHIFCKAFKIFHMFSLCSFSIDDQMIISLR